MLKLVVFKNNECNFDVTAQDLYDKFSQNGFPFTQTVFALNRDFAETKRLAIEDGENYYVFFNPEKRVNEKNIRTVVSATEDRDFAFILSELQRVSGKSYGKCILKVYGADAQVLQYACSKADEVCGQNNVNYKIHTEFGDSKIEIVYDNTTPKMTVDAVIRTFMECLNDFVYAEEDITLQEQLFRLLKLRGKTLSTAESFTGGRVASSIISISGASECFHEGIVAYSNLAKEDRLFVSRDTLYNHGAVSFECCSEMVEGLLKTGRCDVAISTTGIAGPKSDNTKKPVGLCYIGVGMLGGIDVYKYNFVGNREEITETAVRSALFNAVKRLKYL